MSEFSSTNYHDCRSSWKTAMDLPEEPLIDAVKEKIIEVVSYIRSYNKNELEARLVKEEKVLDPYKVFACKKKQAPKPLDKDKSKPSNFDNDINVPYHMRHSYNQSSFIPDFTLEEQSGSTPEAAIEKFFNEAVKSLGRQKKIKEKEFAKLEKDIASMDYLISRIAVYASDDAKKEVKDIIEKENKAETLALATIPAPALVPTQKPSVVDTQKLPALTEEDCKKLLAF